MTTTHDFQDLQEFIGGRGTKSTIPKVRISCSPKGHVSLYFSSAFALLAGDNFKSHILPSYSKKSNALVFEFTEMADKKGLLKMSVKSHSAVISLNSFCRQFEIDKTQFPADYLPMRKQMPDGRFVWVVLLDQKWS